MSNENFVIRVIFMNKSSLSSLMAAGVIFMSGIAVGAPHDTVADNGKVIRANTGESGAGVAVRVAPFQGGPLVDLSNERAKDQLADDLYLEGVEDADALVAFAEPSTSTLAKYAGPESVIGPDRRRRVYTSTFPERATVYITYNDGRWCSGALIGPRTVVTAGHCVERGVNGGFYTRSLFKVYPGSDGTSRPYGYCTAKQLITTNGWANSSNEEYDYGAIILNCTVGNQTGYYGWTTENPLNQPATVQGYPADKNPAGSQWQSNDKVRAASTLQIFYPNDTFNAMSGSPVWYDRNGAYLNGIHAYGRHGSGNHANYNHGVRITSGVAANLLQWRNAQ